MMALSSLRLKHSLALVLVLVCVACLVRESNARPPWLGPDSQVFKATATCNSNVELVELCQRCAKMTRSRKAYPACCSNDIEARKWCTDYVYFGNQS